MYYRQDIYLKKIKMHPPESGGEEVWKMYTEVGEFLPDSKEWE